MTGERRVTAFRTERDPVGARLAAVLQQSVDAVVLTDAEGRVIEANPAAAAMFGFNAADARGRTLDELAQRVGAPPDERAAITRVFEGEVVRYEARRAGPDDRDIDLS